MLEQKIQQYKLNTNIKITYLDTNTVVYGIIDAYRPDGLTVNRILPNKGLGWVPVNHPNVKIEIIS